DIIVAQQLLPPSPLPPIGPKTHGIPNEPVAPNPIGTGIQGLNSAIGNGPSPTLPENPASKRSPTSVLEQGVVISRVQPIYPRLAQLSRIQGSVHLNAVITARGTLEELHVVSGHPMLAQAAL